MQNKIKAILGSIRFWIVTLGWVVFMLEGIEVDGYTMALLFTSIEGWLGTVVAIGTLDSVATRLGLPASTK